MGRPASQKAQTSIIMMYFMNSIFPLARFQQMAARLLNRTTVLTLLGAALATSPASGQDILAYGDLRGYVEPCGCDPETDLGGLARLFQAVREQKKLVPQGLVVDLGYNIVRDAVRKRPAPTTKELIKARTIMAGVAAIKPDAALATPYDIAFSLASLPVKGATKGAPLPKTQPLPWLLTNSGKLPRNVQIKLHQRQPSKGQDTTLSIAQVIEAKGYLVFGVVDPLHSRAAPMPPALGLSYAPVDGKLIARIKSLIKTKTKAKARPQNQPEPKMVILYDGRDEGLVRLKKAFPKASFVRTNRRPNDALADQKEKEQTGLLLHQGVYSVPSFGQGLLTLGAFRAAPLDLGSPGLGKGMGKSMGQGLSQSSGGQLADLSSGMPVPPFIWLSKDFALQNAETHPMGHILAGYRNVTADAFRAAADRKAKEQEGKESPFAGAEACRSCHPAAYDAYQKSAHAHAIPTLVKKKQNLNGECVGCHVVGFDEPGGYIDQERTPHLANVQCEVCHGPRKAHSQDPFKNAGDNAKEVCVSCHHVPHSSAFDYASYWLKIQHGKPQKAKAKTKGAAKLLKPEQGTPNQLKGKSLSGSCGGEMSFCTMEYDPVCGKIDGGFTTYTNSCERAKACAEPAPAKACGMD